MNSQDTSKLDRFVDEVVIQIAASHARRQTMREELLAHLLESVAAEHNRSANDGCLVEAAIERLGNVDELRRQLQQTVPMAERIVFLCLGRKENIMTRLVIGLIVFVGMVIGIDAIFPRYGAFVIVGGCATLAGATLVGLARQNPAVSRWLRPRHALLLGCFGILFAASIILPALGKTKQRGGIFEPDAVVGLVIGGFIVLESLAFIGCGILVRPNRTS